MSNQTKFCPQLGMPRGAEGPGGNFSNSIRKMISDGNAALERQVLRLHKLRVPSDVIDAMQCPALQSLAVETFFTAMREPWPFPYVSQYLDNRARVVEQQYLSTGGASFSYYTGEMCSVSQRPTHAHLPSTRPSKGTGLHAQRSFGTTSAAPIVQEAATIDTYSC